MGNKRLQIYIGQNGNYLKKQKLQPKSWLIRLKSNDIVLRSSLLSSIASCKMELNQNASLPKVFLDDLLHSEKVNDLNASFYTLKDLSNFYLKRKDTANALAYAEKALLIARKSKRPYNILNGLKQVGIVNKEKAAKCFIEFDVRIDSLLNKERR